MVFTNKKFFGGTLLIFVSGFHLALWLMVLPSLWFFMQDSMKITMNPILMKIIPLWGLLFSTFLAYTGWKMINKEFEEEKVKK